MRLPANFSELVIRAQADVQNRTLGAIQRETAVTWAARAEAALHQFRGTHVMHWFSDAARRMGLLGLDTAELYRDCGPSER